MKTTVFGWISLLAASGGCNSASEPRYSPAPEESRISIAGLKSRCDGNLSTPVTGDLTIGGKVIANDLYGEFSREIVIQDASGGIAIAVEGEELSDRFPFGAFVEVRCNGLVLSDYGGKIGLGYPPDEYGSRVIPVEEADRYIRISTDVEEMPRAVRLRFGEVSSRHVDTRVRFDGVRFAEPGLTWCDSDPETGRITSSEREIIDRNGARFVARTLHSCDYALEPLPDGEGSLIGVIDYFGGKFSLRVTFHEAEFPDNLSATDPEAVSGSGREPAAGKTD